MTNASELPERINALQEQIGNNSDNIMRMLDALIRALTIPQLGKDEREVRTKLRTHVKTDLARKIWNIIDGRRSLAQIGKKVEKKPQVVLGYVRRWELANPPLVYVYKVQKGVKIYKRILEINLGKTAKRE